MPERIAASDTKRPMPENNATGMNWLKSDWLSEGEEVVEIGNGAETRMAVGMSGSPKYVS
jgi:hypothetical protein